MSGPGAEKEKFGSSSGSQDGRTLSGDGDVEESRSCIAAEGCGVSLLFFREDVLKARAARAAL